MSKRKFKEEMLQVIAPEIYGPAAVVKEERKPRKIKRVKKDKKEEDVDDLVEFVREFAPRRRVQWRGRKVRPVLRPGTTVVFTPGERSGTASKRSYDEVYGDEDILEQAVDRLGEFAYGKRSRPQEEAVSIPLDHGNPTPSLKPVTLQQVLPSAAPRRGFKREGEDLYPTMQLMVPKRQKLEDVLETMKVDPEVQPEVKVRPIKQVAPGLGVQTVDIKIPTEPMETQTEPVIKPSTSTMEVQTDPWMPTAPRPRRKYGAASLLMPNYALHPSIIPTPGYRGTRFYRGQTTRRRRKTTRRRRRRTAAATSAAALVRRVYRRGRAPLTLPRARYHPSIAI